MSISGFHNSKRRLFNALFVFIISGLCVYGCSGDSGGGGSNGEPVEEASGGWDYVAIKQIYATGLLSSRIRAEVDGNDQAHFVYFESVVPEEPDDDIAFSINHAVWDMETMMVREEDETVVEIDNCAGLGFSLDSDGFPAVAYQGGTVKECGQERQADSMFSIKESGEWSEYTGGIGEVDTDRNPVFTDGLAGANLSVVFDSQGDVHMCYQFRYEGCDSMNLTFPDIYYVKKDRSNLSVPGIEEQVEGNTYVGNSIGYQNNVGDRCAITLDGNDVPAIFYYAELEDGTEGVRVARRQGGIWNKEWVEQGCDVDYISAGRDNDGRLAVAYYATAYVDEQGYPHTHCLKYARESEASSEWEIQLVDETTLCGNYCSLAFNSSGLPAIAYYSEKSHSGYDLGDLKLVRFDGAFWEREVVHSNGDIGLYNSLWFDDDDRALICSYSNTEKTIYLFYPQ